MLKSRLSSRSIILGYLAVGVAAAFAISRIPITIKNEPWFVIGFGILWTVFGLAVAYTAWSREDEAQREAHKSAWYHGGLAGSLVCLIPMAWAARLGDRTSLLAPERFSSIEPLTLVLYGAFILFAFQAAGMLVAWVVWWNSKR